MHYSMTIKNPGYAHHRLTSFVLLSLIYLITLRPCWAGVGEKTAEDYRIKGYEEQNKGNLDAALTYYSKAISLGLNDSAIYNDIAIVYEQMGRLAKAEEFYLKALRNDPEYLPVYTNLAYFYQSQGDKHKAKNYFKVRLEKSRDDDPWKETIRQELNKLDPDFEKLEAQRKKRELEEQKRRKEQEEFTLQVERAENHYARGQQFLNEKRFIEAAEEFDNALSLTPGNPKVIKAHRLALHELAIEGIKEQTRAALEKLEAGDLPAAQKDFQNILTQIPNEPTRESD